MKQIATGRLAQVAGRYAEHAPAATACCNACRTCVQTNLIAAGIGLVVAFASAARRLVTSPGNRRSPAPPGAATPPEVARP